MRVFYGTRQQNIGIYPIFQPILISGAGMSISSMSKTLKIISEKRKKHCAINLYRFIYGEYKTK